MFPMTTDQSDQDPFRDPSIPSLALALEHFMALPDETPSRKARARTATATFGRLVGKEPAHIPAQPNFVMHEFARLKKRTTNLHSKTIANCKSEMRYLMQKCGTPTGRSRFRNLLPRWAALRDRLESEAPPDQLGRKPLFWKFSRFAAFCTAKGVPPGAVTDAVLNEFRDALQASDEVINPEAKVREAIRAWNVIAATSSPPLPALFLAPREVRRWTIPPTDFPQAFQDDVEQWLAEMRHVDPDDEEGRTRALRPDTVNAYCHLAFKAASALVFSGRPIETVTSLKCLVEIDAFKALMKVLRERQDGKLTTGLYGLAMTLSMIARNKEKLGQEHLARLARLCANHKPEDAPTKSHIRLEAFEDEKLLGKHLHLSEMLLEEAANKKTSRRTAKTLAQVAVAMEVEWHSPFRIKNLAILQLHENIQAITVGGQLRWLIRLPASETKNHKQLVFELPTESVRRIERALKYYDQSDGYLFPGANGSHKTKGCLSRQIKDTVEKRLGVPFHTHMMRGLVATLQLKERESGGLEHARAMLGDESDRVIRKSYTANAEIHLIRKAQDTIKRARIRTAPIVRTSGKAKKAA
jgi:integrase